VSQIDPDALITASQLAQLCNVTVAAVCNWRSRGYLKPATDSRGRIMKDAQGRVQYRLLDGMKAEAMTSKAARRVA
jgi:DNA-binding transcriptional MerR regulator